MNDLWGGRRKAITKKGHALNGSALTSQKEASKRNMADLGQVVKPPGLEWKPQLKSRPRLPPFKIFKSRNSEEQVHCRYSQKRVALKNGRVAQASAKEPAQDPDNGGNKAFGRLK